MAKEKLGRLPAFGVEQLLEEMSNADLGDDRLRARFLKLMEALAASPSASFSSSCDSSADLEGLYRFMRNKHVLMPDLLEPHFDETARRAAECDGVIVVHDTSTFRVADDADLDSYINTGKRGFLGHLSLALDGREERKPLGVCAFEPVLRAKGKAKTKKKGRKLSGSETAKLKGKEFARWGRAVTHAEERLQGVDIIHVMDREADSYELLTQLDSGDQSFVVRWCRNRLARLSAEESEDWSQVKELLSKATTTKLKREVHVGRRRAKTAPTAARATPRRNARMASLRFATCTLELRKPRYMPKKLGYPEALQVHVVHVYEPAPPEDCQPIDWVLLTNLPIRRMRDVERVVDVYRQRWLVEEFFKALKTGCAYRKRHLTNRQSIFNTLASFVPIASKALLLRQMARADSFPAHQVLDPTELRVLRARAKKARMPLSPQPTAQEALAVVARMGGHRKSSGPPGWLTLMRGTEKLLNMVEGYKLAFEEM